MERHEGERDGREREGGCVRRRKKKKKKQQTKNCQVTVTRVASSTRRRFFRTVEIRVLRTVIKSGVTRSYLRVLYEYGMRVRVFFPLPWGAGRRENEGMRDARRSDARNKNTACCVSLTRAQGGGGGASLGRDETTHPPSRRFGA